MKAFCSAKPHEGLDPVGSANELLEVTKIDVSIGTDNLPKQADQAERSGDRFVALKVHLCKSVGLPLNRRHRYCMESMYCCQKEMSLSSTLIT